MRNPPDDLTTWAEFLAASYEERRRWRDALLREWIANHARKLEEDERADRERGDWGD